MEYNVYSIRDVKTGFANPFVDVNDDSATRGFNLAFANPTSVVNFSPADFSLYRVGTFNSDTGVIEKCLPVYVCCAMDFVKKGE